MKNKFKVFVKKIKNWLSSLSKWATKHIVPLILVLLFILTMGLTCFSRNKETASAQNLNSSSPVFVVPNLTLNFLPYGQCTTLPIFIGVNNGYPVCYRPMTSGNYEERRFYYSNTIDNEVYYYISNYEFIGYRYIIQNSTINRNYTQLNYNNINGEVYFSFNNSNFTSIADCLSYAVNNSSLMTIQAIKDSQGRSELNFYVVDSNNNSIFDIKIRYFYTIVDFYQSKTIPLFVSSNVSLEYVSQELLNQSYNTGYSQGFIVGSQQGYDNGFNAGIDYSTDPTHFEPFYIITKGVTDFLNFDILGSVSVGTLLSIGFGILLLGFAIKIFLGG